MNDTIDWAKRINENIERYLLVSTYIYITFIVVIGVFNRFILQSSSGWEQETARLMFMWLTWLGASLAVHERRHIRIDIVYQRVSERTEGILYIFSDVIIILFAVVTTINFISVLRTTMNFGASLVTLDLSQFYFQIAIPVGLILMTIRGLQALVRDLRDVRQGRPVFKGSQIYETGRK